MRILVVLAVLAVASACGNTATASPSDPSPAAAPTFGTTLKAPVSSDVLDAPLVDADGLTTTLRALHGKVIVLSDFMTLCAEVCPIGTASMLQAARQIAHSPLGSRVEFVSLSIDPRRDDRRHLRAYQHTFGALPNWLVLGGSPATVDAVWKRLGIWIHRTRNPTPYPRDWVTGKPLTTDLSHTDELIFIDGGQQFRYELDGAGTVGSAKQIPGRLYHFMDALGHRNVRNPAAGDWSPNEVVDVLRWLTSSPT